jgi:hypothetical protein
MATIDRSHAPLLPEVLMPGLASADPTSVWSLIAAGRMPGLARLLAEGGHAEVSNPPGPSFAATAHAARDPR